MHEQRRLVRRRGSRSLGAAARRQRGRVLVPRCQAPRGRGRVQGPRQQGGDRVLDSHPEAAAAAAGRFLSGRLRFAAAGLRLQSRPGLLQIGRRELITLSPRDYYLCSYMIA